MSGKTYLNDMEQTRIEERKSTNREEESQGGKVRQESARKERNKVQERIQGKKKGRRDGSRQEIKKERYEKGHEERNAREKVHKEGKRQ